VESEKRALAFAQEGPDVAIVDIDKGKAAEVVAEIEKLGRKGLL
jgi:hypothetical protein